MGEGEQLKEICLIFICISSAHDFHKVCHALDHTLSPSANKTQIKTQGPGIGTGRALLFSRPHMHDVVLYSPSQFSLIQ